MPRDTSRKVSQNSAWVPELTNTVDARVLIWFDKVLPTDLHEGKINATPSAWHWNLASSSAFGESFQGCQTMEPFKPSSKGWLQGIQMQACVFEEHLRYI